MRALAALLFVALPQLHYVVTGGADRTLAKMVEGGSWPAGCAAPHLRFGEGSIEARFACGTRGLSVAILPPGSTGVVSTEKFVLAPLPAPDSLAAPDARAVIDRLAERLRAGESDWRWGVLDDAPPVRPATAGRLHPPSLPAWPGAFLLGLVVLPALAGGWLSLRLLPRAAARFALDRRRARSLVTIFIAALLALALVAAMTLGPAPLAIVTPVCTLALGFLLVARRRWPPPPEPRA